MNCLLIGAAALSLSGDGFSLSWTHSVERIEWREEWALTEDGLELVQAAVKGSGAGMEPGPDARLEQGWWVWQPDIPAQPQIVLAASGLTPSAWRLCDGDECRDLGTKAQEPVILKPCPES
ncbi:DUF1850 domain-containing protein [Paracoccus aerodenitrificans]|uniref:DUF1850 domain-containing protein n=1 Tax=Paracoccus aerodenitrificans TaxID=3017781 RepID=UPI0022F00981|nr:DUF1850 domain-containing protein [Paracoccus aerodenitrificans]WBU65490.1 DUF1850 domain-containing protein [Paracoccus aerodenitrificans]